MQIYEVAVCLCLSVSRSFFFLLHAVSVHALRAHVYATNLFINKTFLIAFLFVRSSAVSSSPRSQQPAAALRRNRRSTHPLLCASPSSYLFVHAALDAAHTPRSTIENFLGYKTPMAIKYLGIFLAKFTQSERKRSRERG